MLEELARPLTPVPLLPSMTLAAALVGLGGDAEVPVAEVIAALAGGVPGAVAWGTEPSSLSDGQVHGRHELVPGAAGARWLLVPADVRWALIDTEVAGVTVTPRPAVDVTRAVADVELEGVEPVALLDDPDGAVAAAVVRLWCADALGAAAWCVETAATYATVREQFGQPIGRFQGVKHRCADMLCALELARAATWDALRAPLTGDEGRLATAVAAALAPEALLTAAKGCIQVLGGIGFTWEHDAHLYLKRALATSAYVGSAHRWRRQAVELAAGGVRRAVTVDLPLEAEASRRGHSRRAGGAGHSREVGVAGTARRGRLDHPALARTLGSRRRADRAAPDRRGAGGGGHPPAAPPGGCVGAPDDPGARHRGAAGALHPPDASRRDLVVPAVQRTGCRLRPRVALDQGEQGRWRLAAERPEGVDLDGGRRRPTGCAWRAPIPPSPATTASLPSSSTWPPSGIELRPLRELTGQAMFYEVFLADVFVADDDVIGPVGGGWVAARTTLANERVSMGSGSNFGLGVEMVLGLLSPDLGAADAIEVDRVGGLLVDAEALAVLGARMTLRSLQGRAAEPGPEASVRKLLGVEHDQRTQEIGLGLLDRAALADDGDGDGLALRLPGQPLPVDRRRHERDPAQRHRRATPRPPTRLDRGTQLSLFADCRPSSHLPSPDAETEPYWQAAREHRLLIKRCGACGRAAPLPAAVLPALLERGCDVGGGVGRRRRSTPTRSSAGTTSRRSVSGCPTSSASSTLTRASG